MIKPDAFEAYRKKEVITAFYTGIGDFLIGTNKIDHRYLHIRDNAITQIRERSVDELSFQGELSWVCANRLSVNIANHLDRIMDDYVCNVIVDTINTMGFNIISDKNYILTAHDVSCIYSLSDDNNISKRLHGYLDNRTVRILLLSGENEYLLQWIKTFVRHFFINDRTEAFPLKNLIHVSEDDFYYIEKIVTK